MQRTTRMWLLVSTVAAALLVTLIVPAAVAPARATPVGPAVTSDTQWAYGGQRWVNVSTDTDRGTYSAEAFFGWQVVLTVTNTSSTTMELTAQRTLGVAYEAKYCAPDCTSPSAEGQVSILGHESDLGFANLSTVGTVYESGPNPAVALLNTSSTSQANLSESLSVTLTGPNGTHLASAGLNVSGHSVSAVDFGASGLGLVPWNAEPGLQWNSSAPFQGIGSWNLTYALATTNFTGVSRTAGASLTGNVNASGTVDLLGADLGNVTLANGMTVPRIVLAVVGPFDDVDGVILVPHDYNLFGSATHPWNTEAPGVATAATGEVDFVMDELHHSVRIAAAMTTYGAQTAAITAGSVSSGMQVEAAPVGNVGAVAVQAQPESVAQAQSAAQCYLAGCEVGALPSGSPLGLLGGFVGAVLIGLVVATLVGVVAVIEWRAWTRRPEAPRSLPPAPMASARPLTPASPGALPDSPPSVAPEASAGPMGLR